MDKYVFAVFEGNSELSKNTLTLMGIFEDFSNAIENIIDEMADLSMFNRQHTAKCTRRHLEEYRQTPTGFDRRYIIETVELNHWEEVL